MNRVTYNVQYLKQTRQDMTISKASFHYQNGKQA